MGEAKPKHTPEHVIGGLPSGLYKDWATPGCDQRCPICLDDVRSLLSRPLYYYSSSQLQYKPMDSVLKITDCSHWLHKDCLEVPLFSYLNH